MLRKILIFLALAIPAYATVAVRQHADTIVDDKKILASDLDDEFDHLVSRINAIDSGNITDASLTATDAAATSTLVSVDKKAGCRLTRSSDFTGQKSVDISPPCEVFMDGLRGFLTATKTISLVNNLADGALALSSYYYVYATRDTASLGFHFSQTQPNLLTNRKATDSTARYVGLIRTGDATQDIVDFSYSGENIFWTQYATVPGGDSTNAEARAGLVATPTTTQANYTISVPNVVDSVFLKYSAFVDAYPAGCRFRFHAASYDHTAVVVATQGHTGILPFDVPVDYVGANQTLSLSFGNVANCVVGGDLRVVGFKERFTLH